MTGRQAPHTTPDMQKTPARTAKHIAGALPKGKPSMPQTTSPHTIVIGDATGTTRSALVLASLTAAHPELPDMSWTVSRHQAIGGTCTATEVVDRISDVCQWAIALDATVLVSVAHTGDYVTASVSAVVEDVQVDVWCLVYRHDGESRVDMDSRVRGLVIAAGGIR